MIRVALSVVMVVAGLCVGMLSRGRSIWFPALMVGAAVLLLGATPAPSVRRDRSLQRCMVYLPAMHDAKLRRWCLKQAERMP